MSDTDKKSAEFIPVAIAILTISDRRTMENDDSGNLLVKEIESFGHLLEDGIVNDSVQAIIPTGGTGITGHDGTPEAVEPLLDKIIDGFGEMFRSLSYQNIKTSTLQSRALAGVANGTFIFCLPGSPGACKDGWEFLIKEQLDSRTKPCNLVELMPRLKE